MNNNIFEKTTRLIFWCFIVYCGIISGLWTYSRPLIGDDLFYVSDLEVRGGDIKALPHLMAGIFQGCNGRWGDLTNTVWLSLLPRVVASVFAVICAVVLPWAAIKLSGLKLSQGMPVALMTVVLVFLLPWWDMTHLVCMINYPWGTAVVLACLIPLLGNYELRSRWWILGLPVAWMGAAWHEASGVPLVVGLMCWCCLNREWKKFSTIKKWWFVAMITGGLFTISSPAIWNRVAATGVSEYSVMYLLFSSANLSVVLIICLLIILLRNRQLFDRLLHDIFLVFAVASVVSACIVMVGGVVGRAGFFAQTFGAIALMRIIVLGNWLPDGKHVISSIVAILLYVVSGCYVTDTYIRDLKVSRVLEEAVDTYPRDHEAAYSVIMSIPYMEQWDAASLKVYDSRYDDRVDRTESLRLHAEEEEQRECDK